MSVQRALLVPGVLLLVALAPLATAYPAPAVYYLKDATSPAGVKLPAGNGVLSTIVPATLYTDPANVTKNEIGTRVVLPGVEAALPTQFVTSNTTYNQPRIWGPIIAFVFAPKTPAVQNANMSLQMVYLPPGAALTDPGTVVARASVAMDGGNVSLPEPTKFIPPDPTNPEQALAYIEGQALAYGITKLAEARIIAILDDDVKDNFVDFTLPDRNGTIAMRLVLEPGSSPLPIPLAAGQAIVYDNYLTASLLYVPWYAPNPTPPPSPPVTSPPPSSPHPSPSPVTISPTTTSKAKSSPGLEPAIAVLGVALAAAMFARRGQA